MHQLYVTFFILLQHFFLKEKDKGLEPCIGQHCHCKIPVPLAAGPVNLVIFTKLYIYP